MKSYSGAGLGTGWLSEWPAGPREPSVTSYSRCADKHPGLKIGEYVVYGGACHAPVSLDHQIYIALEKSAIVPPMYPWDGQLLVIYPITDHCAPGKPKQFKKFIKWLAERIMAGDAVHVGCIGGHGRTGTVLAALVAYMTKEEDPIAYVRKHYCKRAVESEAQVKFLVKHFGAKSAKVASRVITGLPTANLPYLPYDSQSSTAPHAAFTLPKKGTSAAKTMTPMASSRLNIWRKKVDETR